jgi:hypothetical protein
MRRPTERRSRRRCEYLPSPGFLLSFVSLLCATSACDAKTDGGGVSASASAASTAASTAAAAPSASAKPVGSALRSPMPKAYSETPEQEIGTLPDGVGIAVGEPAPDFELADDDGKKLKLSELSKKSEVLLVFYRGGW